MYYNFSDDTGTTFAGEMVNISANGFAFMVKAAEFAECNGKI